MGKFNVQKSSLFEFDLELGGGQIHVVYKKDEENPSNSVLELSYPNGDHSVLSVEVFRALNEALNEIDPYGFVFSDLEGEE